MEPVIISYKVNANPKCLRPDGINSSGRRHELALN